MLNGTSPQPDQDVRPSGDAAEAGLAAFAVPDRAAHLLDEAIAGIARGIEVLTVVPLGGDRAAALEAFAGAGSAGAPHSLIVACDIPQTAADPRRAGRLAGRLAEVHRNTRARMLRHVPADAAFEVVRRCATGPAVLDLLDALGDPPRTAAVREGVREFAAACAMPFPVIRMLGTEQPGFRARVALVDHPVHGRSVCKIFRPGAAAFFERERHARIALADQPVVPQLLEHGPNWLLTPEYHDTRAHLARALPGVAGMHQLRPDAARELARFAAALHERGLFMLDLSPQNVVSDPVAGLKVLDLEFVIPYADYPVPAPPASASWSVRGIPAELRTIDVPQLALTRKVGNSVFHPAVAGLPVERLLGSSRRGDGTRRVATQWGWYATLATAGRLHAAVARRGRL
jgi:hypothetical protein